MIWTKARQFTNVAALTTPVFLPQATALFAAMSVQPTTQRKVIINALIQTLITDDLWDDLDVLYVVAAHDAQAGRLNWKAPSTFEASVIGTPTFTADQGYTGNGTDAALDTGFVPSTDAVQMTTNAAHTSAWTRTSRTTSATHALFGAAQGSPGPITQLFPNLNSGGAFSFMRLNDRSTGVTAPANIQGYWLADRPDSTGYTIHHNGGALPEPLTDTAVGLPNISIHLLANNGVPAGFSADQISIFTAGAALGSTKRTALYNAFTTYLTAIGAL